MHLLAEHTIDISCPVDAAYRYASNLEHFGEWFPGVIAIESANGLAISELGKKYLETVAIPLRGTKKVWQWQHRLMRASCLAAEQSVRVRLSRADFARSRGGSTPTLAGTIK